MLSASQKTYDPWYTGSLNATSGSNLGKGLISIQPYLSYYDVYGQYTQSWGHHSVPNIRYGELDVYFQMGLNSWLDATVNSKCYYKESRHEETFQFGDSSIFFGLQLLAKKDFTPIPSIRLTLKEIFPTGKYKNLDPKKNGIDAGGQGSYQTSITLILSKVHYWIANHPISWRIDFEYSVPAPVKVKNFNAYGGGYNTKGKVAPGMGYQLILSLEYSFTQRWAYAMDFIYYYSAKDKFKGYAGTNSNGTPASMYSPSSAYVVLSPALEYNFNANLGIIGGLYFTVAGKNSQQLISGQLSLTYTF